MQWALCLLGFSQLKQKVTSSVNPNGVSHVSGSGQRALDRAVAAADREAQDKDGGKKKKKCASSPCCGHQGFELKPFFLMLAAR